MKLFYIDTSSSYLYSAIVDDDKLLISCSLELNKDLSKYALSEVEKLFDKVNLTPNDVDKIIVVSGPGSFTGIRIGMTIAKIIAWSLQKEITTITSLDAMALTVKTEKLVVPLIDARRGFVYSGIYLNGQPILENQYIKFSTLLDEIKKLNKEYVFITNQENFELENNIKYEPNFLEIIKKYANKLPIHPHLVEPTYLKLTEAEENLKHDN